MSTWSYNSAPCSWKLRDEIGGSISGKNPGTGHTQTQQGGLCPSTSADSPIWQGLVE